MAFKRLSNIIKELKREDARKEVSAKNFSDKELVVNEIIENIFPGAEFRSDVIGAILNIHIKSPAMKNEFFMKKDLLLKELRSQFGNKISEINFPKS